MNCHGCKWLDEVKSGRPGDGYCSMVERSDGYKPGIMPLPSSKVRRPFMERCELYEAGDFAKRFQEGKR